MSRASAQQYERGIFIEECKHRFLCRVELNGQEELCYVASSSKLAPFVDLVGRDVLLMKNDGEKSKTKYTLQAVHGKDDYILLNLGFVNTLLHQLFVSEESGYFGVTKIYREKKVLDTLKADFVIEGEENLQTIIEAKGIITEEDHAYMPAMKVGSAERQLEIFNKLLRKNFQIHYYVVLMNPATQVVYLNKAQEKVNG